MWWAGDHDLRILAGLNGHKVMVGNKQGRKGKGIVQVAAGVVAKVDDGIGRWVGPLAQGGLGDGWRFKRGDLDCDVIGDGGDGEGLPPGKHGYQHEHQQLQNHTKSVAQAPLK